MAARGRRLARRGDRGPHVVRIWQGRADGRMRAGRQGHRPARRARAGDVAGDGGERGEVRVPGDEEGARVVERDVVRGEGHRDARGGGERVARGVAGVEEDLAEGGGGDGDGCAVWGDGDAVGERDPEAGERVCDRGGFSGGGVVHCDVREPAEGEPEERLREREGLAEDGGQAAREQVVVGHVERGGRGERECVRGDEVRGGERADPRRAGGRVPLHRELLDGRLLACVVDDEQVRRLAWMGRVDFGA